MRISFYITTPKEIRTRIVDTPMGGSEVSTHGLAESLWRQGHDVRVYCKLRTEFKDGYETCLRHYNDAWEDEHDIFILCRMCNVIDPMKKLFKHWPRKIILWTGDAYDQSNNQLLFMKRIHSIVDAVCVKSDWQRDTMLKYFPVLSPEKVHVTRKGVKDVYFDINSIPKDPNKFIHASTVYRGAQLFTQIWPKIKEVMPDAYLDLYSKTELYLDNNPKDRDFDFVFEQLVKLPDVNIKYPVPQRQLVEEMYTSQLMLYPNYGFEETSCGAVLESMAMGTPVITSAQGGLTELIKNMGGGTAIEGDPTGDQYQSRFVEEIVRLCQDKTLYKQIAETGRKTIQQGFTWDKVAKDWETVLQ